jgi:dolichol-phosphate mannosyltransferase
MLISVVFSFRNEEKNIKELIYRVDRSIKAINFKNIDYELIFVNDYSDDNSENLLVSLQSKYPIKIINMARKFGVCPCVLAGLNESKGDAVIYMDSDLQDPPELIEKMIPLFLEGADVIHTFRTKRHGESKFKMYATNKAYDIINFFSDIELKKNAGDFKLLSRRAVNHILSFKEIDPYFRGLSVWIGLKQVFIPYERNPRYAGSSKFSLLSSNPALEFIRGITSFSVAPLYFSFMLGIFSIFISLFLVIYALGSKFLGFAVNGMSGVIISIAFFSSVILFSIGILSIYISKIYLETKGRPRYIIDSIKEKIK